MKRPFITFAKFIYGITPFSSLRKLYFKFFCHMVKNRQTRVTVDGMRFDLDLGEMIDLGIYLQQYEPDVTSAIHRYCQAGMTVFDIGANIGAHTLRFAKLVGPRGRVFAFEPTDYAYQKLVRNLSLNPSGHVSAIRVALSSENLKQQQIDFRSSWRIDKRRADGISVVDFERLDDWCITNSVNHVDLIKLDVDGNEYPLIMGSQSIIEHCQPIILMEAVGLHFNDDARNPFSVLRKMNYRFWDTKSGREYTTLYEMKSLFPAHDFEMTMSINVIAAMEIPSK